MNIPTTIKIAITAYGGLDEDHAAFNFTYEVNGERPEAAVLRLAAMLIGASQHAPTLRAKLADALGLDPCELDVTEAELEQATPPACELDSLAGLDTDATSAAKLVEAIGASESVTLLRATMQREQNRDLERPRRAVRAPVISACEGRIAALDGKRWREVQS